MSSVGIVLKRFAHSRYKFALLDKRYGRFDCIVSPSLICIGSLITYTLQEKNGNFFAENVQSVYAPIMLGAHDLLFLHHVLEILYYFSPAGSCVNGVFDLLAFLYTIEHMLISKKFKKFFLLKLLNALAITPELEDDFLRISTIGRVKLDQFNDDVFDCEDEKKLDRWLWHCMWQHPYISEFKTVHFLEKNRAL